MAVGFLCVSLIVLPIALLIGAVILRAAVSFTNQVVGGKEPSEFEFDDDDEDDFVPRPRLRSVAPVPRPSLFQGMAILFVIAIVNGIVSFAAGMAIRGAGIGPNANGLALDILAPLAGVSIGFIVMALMLAALLPTTFLRGCLVALFYFLICIAIAIVVLLPIYLFAAIG